MVLKKQNPKKPLFSKDKFWGEVFTDDDGSFSFKRLQTAVFTFLFTTIIIADLFFKLKISENLVDILGLLIAYGYTGIVIERFIFRK